MVFFTVSGCYSFKQAWMFGSLMVSSKSLDQIRTGDDVIMARKIDYLQSVLDVAKIIGIDPGDSYRRMVFPKFQNVSFLVVATPFNSLIPYSYWFPFVGSVPYKGFFQKNDAEEFASSLSEKGHDVYQVDVGGFSLLGFLDDPIFPAMLRRDNVALANLIFHELTHKHIWLRGQTEFNEQIAEFIADKATILFLTMKNEQEFLEIYFSRKKDRMKYLVWVNSLSDKLTDLYDANYHSDSYVVEKKKNIIDLALRNKPKFDSVDFIIGKVWNNASIAMVRTYGMNFTKFERAFECIDKGSDEAKRLNLFISKAKGLMSSFSHGEDILTAFCLK